jgi:hypothetical protein
MSNEKPEPTPTSGKGGNKTASIKPPATPRPGVGAPLSKSDKGGNKR